MKRILLAATIAAATFGSSFAQGTSEGTESDATEFIGSIVFPDNANGVWSYTTDKWAPRLLAQNVVANAGGYVKDNFYYITRYVEIMGIEAIQTVSYDMSKNWEVYDEYKGDFNYIATTMAYNPIRDEVVGCFYNEDRQTFRLAFWENYTPRNVIRQLDNPWAACTFGPDGTLYAIERNGDLFTVSTKNGEMTKIGSTGLASEYATDATFDKKAGKIIFGFSDGNSAALYHIDPATAAATKLYDLNNVEQICGMDAPFVAPADGVPAKVSSISTSFSGTNKTGKVSFSMPTQTKGGTRINNEVPFTYTLKANGTVIATATALAGARINIDWTATDDDKYNFEVTTTNEAGTSMPCRAKKYIGFDTPKPANYFQTSITGNTVTLSWSGLSTTGVNGGSIPSADFRHTVVRNDGKVIVENTTTNRITDEIEIPEEKTEYYYTLTTTANELSAEPKESTHFFLGTMDAPYESTFTTSLDLAGWTYAQAENVTNAWAFYSYGPSLRLYGSGGFDSWAFTPAVRLEAGYRYPFTMTVKTNNYNEESFEVKFGTAPTIDAMSGQVIDVQTMKSSTAVEYSGEIITTEAGKYYIGFHGLSNPSREINLISFTLGEGVNISAPAKVTEFEVSALTDGTPQATVKFNLPTTTIGGVALEGLYSLTSYTISRDGEAITTVTENVTPGATVEFVDNTESLVLGTHTYSVTATNKYGDSPAELAEVIVGPHRPLAPESANMVEDGNTGKVTITWSPVTTDVDGNTIKADAVTYRIMNRYMETVADNISGTSFEIQAVEEGSQSFVQFGVYAKTISGESEKFAATAYKPVGAPSVAPWKESFADCEVHSPWGFNYIKGNEPWQIVREGGTATPQDKDGGFAFFEAYSVYTAFVSGKVDLSQIEMPALTYYTYNYNETPRTNSIDVQVDCGDGEGFVSVQENVVSETGPAGTWNKVVVRLDKYAGMTVSFRFEPKNADLAYYYLDNIVVAPYVDYNLTADRLTGPAAADLGKEFEVQFTYTNTGENAINRYTVELWNGEELIESREGTAIEPADSKTITFAATPEITHGDALELRGVINCAIDMVESDNTTENFSVGIVAAVGPVIDDLSFEKFNGNEVSLKWSAPDIEHGPAAAMTESFEKATVWSEEVEGWKLVDGDGKPNGGIQIKEFPINQRATSWVVTNPTSTVFQNMSAESMVQWAAHTGNQFLISSYVMAGGQMFQSDDWAISPKLYGGPQAISFYAKSFDAEYLEDFEVLYSTRTTATEDFESLAYVIATPNTWKQYRYKLPDGTKYFAIRSRSTNKFFLFIDDVTFVPAEGEPAALELKGYNIYRNGNKLNDNLLTEQTYTEIIPASVQKANYFVTAVYATGEGLPSNILEYDPSGIYGVNAYNVSFATADGCIIVRGATEGKVSVFSVDGRNIASESAIGFNSIKVAPGVYIVNAGSVSTKVVVR